MARPRQVVLDFRKDGSSDFRIHVSVEVCISIVWVLKVWTSYIWILRRRNKAASWHHDGFKVVSGAEM